MMEESERMKRIHKIISILVACFLGSALGILSIYVNPLNTVSITYPSRVYLSFEDSVRQADVIAKVEINDIFREIDNKGLKQTIHNATVIETIKGDTLDNIMVMQDGTYKQPIYDNPMFTSGEYYILVMNKAKSVPDLNDVYWITKEYYCDGDYAVQTLPGDRASKTNLLTNQNDNLALGDNTKDKISKLPFIPEILNIDLLKAKIEGGL